MKAFGKCCSTSLVALCLAQGAQSAVISNSDLWDVSRGTVVTAHSPVLGQVYGGWTSDARNMFGAAVGSTPDTANNTIFEDYGPAGTVHWVEWRTAAPITLASFNLVAAHDAGSDGYVVRDINYRGLSDFRLYSGDGAGNWTSLYSYAADPDGDADYGGGPSYPGQHYLELAASLTPTLTQFFRAEFVQYGPYPRTAGGYADSQGPRILELDGYGPVDVPEPATVALFGLGLAGLGAGRRRR